MASAATVAVRPPARRTATVAAARSIWAICQPPKMPPEGLVSAGMAMVRIAGASAGGPWGLGARGGGGGLGVAPDSAMKRPLFLPNMVLLPTRAELSISGTAGARVRAPRGEPKFRLGSFSKASGSKDQLAISPQGSHLRPQTSA